MTGVVRIFSDNILGTFDEDDTIVRASNAPNCVIYTRSSTKPLSAAGTLTVGGTLVGADGGLAQPAAIDPIDGPNFYADSDTIFPPDADNLVALVDLQGTPEFPAFTGITLHTPLAGSVTVTKPVLDDGGGQVTISSTDDLEGSRGRSRPAT